jgi:hypothetical protein
MAHHFLWDYHDGKRQQQQPNRSKRLKEAAQMPQT